jgi:hypothetical protein
MLLFLAGFGSPSSHTFSASLFLKLMLVLFELSLEAQIRQNCRSVFPHEGDGLLEGPLVLLHDISDDQR